MPLRRLLGLLVVLPMLHLTLVGSDEVCAEHATSHPASAEGAAEQHAHAEHAQDHQGSGTHHERHTSPRCCDAVSSCMITFAVNEHAAASPDLHRIGAIPPATPGRLIARTLGPEPPPPKI